MSVKDRALKRALIDWSLIAVVGAMTVALSACGTGSTSSKADGAVAETAEATVAETEQSADLERWLRNFYGIDQWSDFETSDTGLVWQRAVEGVEVNGSRAILHLGIHPDNPDTSRLGDEAATTVVQQIRANDPPEADGVTIVQAVDMSGTVIGNERR